MTLWRRILADRRATVVPLLVVFALNVGAMAFVVVPLERRARAAEAEALSAMADTAAARREEQRTRAARDSVRGADEDLRTFYDTVLPQGFDGAVQVTGFWLNRVAERVGVQFERGRYEVEGQDDSQLERMIAKASLTGEYEGVRRFLHAVESAPEFVIIDRIELAQPDDVGGGGAIELLLDISTYYRARESGPVRRTGR